MAHYCFLNSLNIVEQVIVGKDENDLVDLPEEFESWEDFYGDLHKKKCLRTSYNTYRNQHIYFNESGDPVETDTPEKSFRGNYAGIGFFYDEENNVFIPPQPFESWNLNETIWDWESPVPYPDDGQYYEWSEKVENWILIP